MADRCIRIKRKFLIVGTKTKQQLLTAKTGTGETRAVMFPLLRKRESGIAVYPTNELLRDQVRAVHNFAKSEGFNVAINSPWIEGVEFVNADIILVPIGKEELDRWEKKSPSKGRIGALEQALDTHKPTIVFTNPDILFRILSLRYHAGPLALLQQFKTVIFDEFHLYHGVELAHALIMISMARSFGFFKRVFMLSATPHPDVRAILNRLYEPRVISPSPWTGVGSSRVAVDSVEVTPIQVSANDSLPVLLSHLKNLKLTFERLRSENTDAEYIPAVVIVNSVVNAIRLEDQLVSAGFDRASMAIIRGLSNRAIRNSKGKLLAIGTSAIEVGVDFQCDYLLFEASEASSFIQRFGRVGRHRPGRAIVLVPPNVYAGMSNLAPEIDRASFETLINTWYPSTDAKPWFVTTLYGMLTARAMTETFLTIAKSWPGIRTAVEDQLREQLESLLDIHSQKLDCAAEARSARKIFERSARGVEASQWVKAYCAMSSFRTSLPSVCVLDWAEKKRRGGIEEGKYDADLLTLLKRAVNIKWEPKLNTITIDGIGNLRRVHASDVFNDMHVGDVLETDRHPDLRLHQENNTTPVSDLMDRKNHIFALVKKNDVEANLDWRLPVFDSGPYLLAFDGAALLLLELARRKLGPTSDLTQPSPNAGPAADGL